MYIKDDLFPSIFLSEICDKYDREPTQAFQSWNPLWIAVLGGGEGGTARGYNLNGV